MFSFKVLAIMAIYLLITVSHIFYLSNNTAITTSHSVSLFKRKLENVQCVSAVQRTDKATFKENNVQSIAKIAVLNLVFPYINAGPACQLKLTVLTNIVVPGSHKYGYISLCTLRI